MSPSRSTVTIGRDDELRRLAALFASDAARVLIIEGPPGVGKSHLLRALIADRAADVYVEPIFAGPGVGQVSFGAITHLLPIADPLAPPSDSMVTARAALLQRARGRNVVLAIDDLHELDGGTAALVHQLVAHDEARVAATAVSGHPLAEPLAAIERSVASRRVAITPLDRGAHDDLVASRLPGGVDPDLLETLWTAARGHPLFTHLALDFALDDGSVGRSDTAWSLRGPVISAPVVDVVADRLRRLAPAEQRALAALSALEPLPDSVATVIAGHEFSRLRRRGLARTDTMVSATDSTLTHWVASHSFIRDAALQVVGADTVNDVIDDIAEVLTDRRLDGDGGLRIKIAHRRADGGRPVPADLAAYAAFEALRNSDFARAERLIDAAGEDRTLELDLARARVMAVRGRGSAALELLDSLEPADSEQLVVVAITRAQILGYVLGRPADAAASLSDVSDRLPAHRTGLVASERALYGAMAGDFKGVIEAGQTTLDQSDADPASLLTAYVNLSLANCMLGRIDRLDALTEQAHSLASQQAMTLPLAGPQLQMLMEESRTFRGDLEPHVDGMPNMPPVFAQAVARHLLVAGCLVSAERLGREAADALSVIDQLRVWPLATGSVLVVAAHRRPLDRDDLRLLDQATEAAAGEIRALVFTRRAGAWATARSESGEAAQRALRNGGEAIARDHVSWGIHALHDGVRFGHPDVVIDALEQSVALTSGAPLLDAFRSHARALVERDLAALVAVAEQYGDMRAHLLACETWTQAADIVDGATHRRLQFRAFLAARHLEEAPATPATVRHVNPLTKAETETALAAMEGRSSRTIADERFVSVRTVDNQLRAVYRRLGLGGRHELIDVFAPRGATHT